MSVDCAKGPRSGGCDVDLDCAKGLRFRGYDVGSDCATGLGFNVATVDIASNYHGHKCHSKNSLWCSVGYGNPSWVVAPHFQIAGYCTLCSY